MKDFDAVYLPQRENEYSTAFQLWSVKTLLIGNLDAFDIQTEAEHTKQKSSAVDLRLQQQMLSKKCGR